MTTRDEAVEALRAGQNSQLGDPNPYDVDRPLLRRIWFRGHMTALELRTAQSPSRQAFLRGRAGAG